MRVRLSLSVKILVWLFLNFVLLLTLFLLLFNAQFHFDWKWMFLNSARPRIETIQDLLSGELNTTGPETWKNTMNRYSKAYHVHFSLWDEAGNPLTEGAGEPLPESVRNRILLHQLTRQSTAPISSKAEMESLSQQGGAGLKRFPVLLRTSNPTRYWLLIGLRLNNQFVGGEPKRLVLIAKAKSISMGGLIVDLPSWIRIVLGTFLLSLLFWIPMLRGITRSIEQLTHATKRIADGHFDTRVNDKRRDELGLLAKSVNQMGSRLEDFTKGQKQFLGDVAHELCSPLARLQMALGIIEERADDRTYLKSAMDTSAQIAGLVNKLLFYSKTSFGPTSVKKESLRITEIVQEAIHFEGLELDSLHLDIPPELRVIADSEILIRSLANLIRNALRHGAKPIQISAHHQNDRIEIRISDSGHGVPENDLARIFDAFYRVDSSRTRETGGTGLGLALVKTGIESCGGSVSARNLEPNGFEVLIQF